VGDRGLVDRLTEDLRARGIPVVSGPRVTGDGYYESVIEDPDGNLIEICA
jgi:lactoylglutathione lyase